MAALFRFGWEYRLEIELEVRLDYQLGRLADLIQVLAHSEALITDLNPDRSHYPLGMGELSTKVKLRVRDSYHRDRVLEAMRAQNFHYELKVRGKRETDRA